MGDRPAHRREDHRGSDMCSFENHYGLLPSLIIKVQQNEADLAILSRSL